MKKLTKKQRREIYLKAAKLIERKTCDFCCIAVKNAIYKEIHIYISDKYLKDYCPEFYLFKPIWRGVDDSWFGKTEIPENQQARIDALLFCIAMCE